MENNFTIRYEVRRVYAAINSEENISVFNTEEEAKQFSRLYIKGTGETRQLKVYKVMYSEEAIDTIEPNEQNEQE